MTGPNRFDGASGRWLGVVGRLRDAVRQQLVTAQLLEVAGGGARDVLDIGCGQGTQAIALARAGHRVTGLDPSAELLETCAAAVAAEPEEVRRRVRLVHGAGERAVDLVTGQFGLVL